MMTKEEERQIRFYHWALWDAQREINEDFPLLTTIHNPRVKAYIHLYRNMDALERTLTNVCVVTRFHKEAARLLGQDVNPEWDDLYQRFMQSIHQQSQAFTPLCVGFDLDNRDWQQTMFQELSAILGDRFQRVNRNQCHFLTPIPSWWIRTEIGWVDTGSFLRCEYEFIQQPDEYVGAPGFSTQRRTSIMRWLGCGHTEWILGSEEDWQKAVQSIAKISKHFISQMTSLFS
jgi:hypothetical protein